MKTAFHETVGRPAFRPTPVEVLGRRAAWTFAGAEVPLRVSGPEGLLTDADVPGLSAWLRQATQFAEYNLLAGPKDADLEHLGNLGYRPEADEASSQSRVGFERSLVDLLADQPVSGRELRVYLVYRELVHEYLDPFKEICTEYGISLGRDLSFDTKTPGSGRAKMMQFAEAVPTLKVAVDLKYGLYRDKNRTWTLNHVSDIDAVAVAAPYCRVVVSDADTASRAKQTRTGEELGTLITASLEELLDLLPALSVEAAVLGGDPTGWDEIGPGIGFNTRMPRPMRRNEDDLASNHS